MAVNQEHEISKDIYNTGRRSAISTSELGLYSDHSDQYNTNNYSTTVRKLVIGIMVVVSAILIGIFLYDFASSASINSKVSQETKHIYILQNSLRKPSSAVKRPSSGVTPAPTIYIVNSSRADDGFEDRADNERNIEYKDVPIEKSATQQQSRLPRLSIDDDPEYRMQNLKNFKIRNKMLESQHDEEDMNDGEEKQMVDNHAMMYRVRGLKYPEPSESEEVENNYDNHPATPFRFELKGPHPASFKRTKYPQLTQYRYSQTSRNIQDIIKYLTNDPETLNRGIKFTGIYVNPKKYDTGMSEAGELEMSSDRTEDREPAPPYAIALNADPLYQYKPKHPTDVNLLATSNFRFSPSGVYRYNPFYDPYYQRPAPSKQSAYQENQYDNTGAYAVTNYGKKRKPKPFSVMLDIYPISDTSSLQEPSKKSTITKPPSQPQIMMDDPADPRRQVLPFFARYPKTYGMQYAQLPPGLAPIQSQPMPEEEEKHQMILHLNVYPKRRNKVTRTDSIDRSESMPAEEKEQLLKRMIIPFEAITKQLVNHAAVEGATFEDEEKQESKTRYEETLPAKEKSDGEQVEIFDDTGLKITPEKFFETTQSNNCVGNSGVVTTVTESANVDVATTTVMPTTMTADATTTVTASNIATTAVNVNATSIKNESSIASDSFKDIDTVEGFQKFADSLIAMD